MMARTAWVHLCIIQLPSWLWASALMTSEVLRLVTDDGPSPFWTLVSSRLGWFAVTTSIPSESPPHFASTLSCDQLLQLFFLESTLIHTDLGEGLEEHHHGIPRARFAAGVHPHLRHQGLCRGHD